MRKTSGIFMFIAVSAMILSSCGKYEEGPAFSLRTKTARITGEWQVEKVFENGNELTGEETEYYDAMTVKLDKDGTGLMTVNLSFEGMDFSFSEQLEWQFSDDKTELEVRTKDSEEDMWSEWTSSTILRLTNDELWVEDEETYNDQTYITETRFKKL